MTENQEAYETGVKVIDRRIQVEPEPKTDFLTVIERLASRPDIDPDKIKQFMDMQERILDRNAKQAFNAAMTKAQSRIELVVAKSENTQTKSNYAKLKAVLLSAKPIYTDEGFSLMFYEGDSPKESQKRVCVDIMHDQGHTETRHGDFTIQTTGIAGKSMMTQIHGEGSAFSYGRRYLTCMIFNIPTGDDDDGNSAGGPAYIDDKQLSSIVDMINEKNVDEVQFLGYMGVESTDKILSKDFSKAMVALKKAKGRQREPGDDDT